MKKDPDVYYLSDIPEDVVTVDCTKCGGHWEKARAALLAEHGDMAVAHAANLVAPACPRERNYSDMCQSRLTIDLTRWNCEYEAAMGQYLWLSQLAAVGSKARLDVTCANCGHHRVIYPEKMRKWLHWYGRGHDIAMVDLPRHLQCGGKDWRASGWGCGERVAQLDWSATRQVPAPSRFLKRPPEPPLPPVRGAPTPPRDNVVQLRKRA